MCLSGVSMLRGAAISLIPLIPSLSLLFFKWLFVCVVENYSLEKFVFGPIYRKEVPLEAALQIAGVLMMDGVGKL